MAAAELHSLEGPPEDPTGTTAATTAVANESSATVPSAPAPATASKATTSPATVQVQSAIEAEGAPPAMKRQRRPSVRLGEIGGDHPTGTVAQDPHVRRQRNATWRAPKDSSNPTPSPSPHPHSSKSVKARSLTHLVNGDAQFRDVENNNFSGIFDLAQQRKTKLKRAAATKRSRSSWTSSRNSREDDDEEGGPGEGFRDFDFDSGSPSKEHISPVPSTDGAAVALDKWQRRPARRKASRNRDNGGMDFGNARQSDYHREVKVGSGVGVRRWLVELGLSRYAPVFEIHEVDDEILPMLTLEDLKDMGINAVGSRRKMYSAILKLRKGCP